MIRDYVKINEQDLRLAEEFFENDKHFNEWLVNVFRYYRGKNIEIKTKIVLKYFNNYKKTMDYILASVKTGEKGAEEKARLQALKEATLEGVVVAPLEPSLQPNIEVVSNNKEIVIVNADKPPRAPRKTFIQPDLKEVAAYFELKKVSGAVGEAESFIDHYTSNGWLVGKVSMKDWEAACRTWIRNKAKFSGNNITNGQQGEVITLPDNWITKK